MKTTYTELYELDDDITRLDFDTLEEWLSTTYWTPNIGKAEIIKAAENSALVVGCYQGNRQAGYMRLVGDRTRIGHIMDVYVDEAHRGKGIARAMILFTMEHPAMVDVYQWTLATRDAHSVYAKLGFEPLPNPERWMILKKDKTR